MPSWLRNPARALSDRFWSRRAPVRGPVRLGPVPIYVLPTREGIFFVLTVGVLLIGSINYAVSLGFALTFLLAGVWLVCAIHAHRTLAGLTLEFFDAEPVFSGREVHFGCILSSVASRPRPDLRLGAPQGEWTQTACGGPPVTISLSVPAERRGVLPLGRVTLETRYPLGLFRAFAIVNAGAEALVYPAPGRRLPLPPSGEKTAGAGAVRRPSTDGDEFSQLRPYVPGDPPKRISWKSFSRSREPLLKTFEEAAGAPTLDFDALPGLDAEERLSVLARWILDADRQRTPYRLKLPSTSLAAGWGPLHRRRCLEALARWTPE